MFNKIATRLIQSTLTHHLKRTTPLSLKRQSNLNILNLSKFMFCTKSPTLKPKTEEISEEGNLFLQQNTDTWKGDAYSVIAQYPFHHIPIAFVRNPTKLSLPESSRNDLIAFKALTLLQKDLPLAIDLILPEQFKYTQFLEVKSGQQLYDLYFQSRIQKLTETLNQAHGTLADRLAAMKTLIHLSPKVLAIHQTKQLDERNVVKQDETGALTALYLNYLIRNQKNYTHLIPHLLQKLQLASNSAENKVIIAKAVFTTPGFESSFPQKIIDLSLEAFIQNLPQLHSYELLYSLRLLYHYQSQSAKRYAQALMKHIIQVNIEEGSIDFHVPLILKTIKYCHRQRLSCDPLLDFITKNMVRFKVIFTKKNISKGLLFSLIFSKTNGKQLSQQVTGYLKEFFFSSVKELTEADEVEENELIRFSKLLLKYFWKLSQGEQEYMRDQYFNYIIPHFNHSKQVLYYSLLVVLREKRVCPQKPQLKAKFERQNETIKKYLLQYLNSCCNVVKEELRVVRNLTAVIELMYQISRHQFQFNKRQLPALLKYDFTAKETIEPEVVSFFFSYLIHCKESKEDIRAVMTQIAPQIQIYLRKRKIYSLITIYAILDVCDRVSFQHDRFYKFLENAIADQLIERNNTFIQEKDVRFINDKLIKRGYGSRNLKNFIEGVLQNPKNWVKLKKEYAQKERSFRERIYSKNKRE